MDKKILKTGLPLLLLAGPLQAAPMLSHVSGRAGGRFAKVTQQHHQTSIGVEGSSSFAAFVKSPVVSPQVPQIEQSQVLSFLQQNNLLGAHQELSTSNSGQLDSSFYKSLSTLYCNPPTSISGCGGDTPPTATAVTFSGTLQVGQTLTGSYSYADTDGDTQAGTTFKWYRSNTSGGSGKVAISGATNQTYVLVAADAGKFISFEVTPKNANGTGSAAESAINSTAVAGPTVSLSVSPSSIAEAAGTATVTATLSSAASTSTSVNLSTSGSTASGGGEDFNLSNGTITIVAGQTTGTVVLTAVQDTLDESNETVVLNISNVSGGDGATENGTQQVTVTITDDDPEPSLSIADVSQSETDSNNNMTFTISLSAASGKTVSVDVNTSAGSATAGEDYAENGTTLTFTPGQTSKTFDVLIGGDNDVEPDEYFDVTLSSPVNATIADGSATGIIQNDEDSIAPTVSSIVRQTPSVQLTNADSLTWRVTFDETVTGVDAVDFALTGPTGASLSVSGSGSVYDVTASGGNLASYSGAASVSFAGGQNITDSAGNVLTATTPSGSSELSYTLDNTGPVISAVSIPNAALKIGDTVTATITVSTDADSYSLVSGSIAGYSLSNLTKVNDTTYTASFTVTAGADVAAGSNLPVSLVLADSLGNDSATYNTAISQNADAIDASIPTVSSIVRDQPASALTNAASVSWTVSFSENVSSVDSSDFTLTTSGSAGGTISNVTAVSGSAYTVTVSSATGDGTLRLDLNAAGTGITDTGGNAIASGYTSGQTYTFDHTGPAVTSVSVPASSSYAAGAQLDFTLNFSEAVTLDTTGGTPRIAITMGSSTVYASYVSGSGGSALTFSYTVQSGDLDADGIALAAAIDLNGGTIKDSPGNDATTTLNSVGSTSGILVDAVDPAAPSTPDMTSGTDTGSSNTDNITGDETPTFTGTAEAGSTVTLYDTDGSTVLGTATADGSGNWSITSTPLSAGSHTVTAKASDTAGNVSVASSGLSIDIDLSLAALEVTTNSDSGDDFTIAGSLTADNADGTGLSLREALYHATNNGIITFYFCLDGQTINLSAAATVKSGVTLDTSAVGTLTISGSQLDLLGGITLSNNATQRLTLNSDITGSGTLVKAGSGELTLGSTNNSSGFSGDVTVSAGRLHVGSDSAFSSGTLTLDGGILTNNGSSFNLDNPIVLGSSGGGVFVSNASQTLTLSGTISGSGALSKTSGGNLTLTGTNSFSGGLSVSGANGLTATDGSNLGAGAVTLNESTVLTLTGSAATINNAINLAGSATISNANAITLAGVISGTGSMTKTDAGILSLSATNTATGDVSVSAGGLTISGGNSIADTAAVSVSSGATFTLGGGGETIGSLSGAGNVALTSYRLTTGGNNSSSTFSGVIAGTGSGFTKAGTGIFTLTGNNTYTGSTTVSAGTLSLNRTGGAIADASSVTVASGATILLYQDETLASLAGAGNINLSTFTLTAGGGNTSTTFSGVLSGSGNLIKTGTGTLTLSGSNSYTGTTAVTAGVLSVAGDANLGSSPLSITDSELAVTAATTIDNSMVLTGAAVINNSSAATLDGVISGTGSLTKSGAGALRLSATNSYTGATAVSAGTLLVNGDSSASASATVASGATLGGTGSLPGVTVASGASLSPGNSGAGSLTITDGLTIAAGGNLLLDIAGATAGSQYDQLTITGAVDISGASMSVNHSYTGSDGDSYTVILNDSTDAITGAFSGAAEGSVVTANGNSSSLTVSYLGGTGNDASLTFVAVPGAPTAVSASAANASASVSFTAPTVTGSTAITSYTVTSNPGNLTASGAGSPILISGLTNGTAYTFTVRATNSAGAGAASSASNAVTPTAPAANSVPVIAQGSSTSVTMSEDGAPTAFSLSLSASDADADTLSWSISAAAQNGSASVSGGIVSYSSSVNYNGTDSFVVQVSDGEDTASISVNVLISPVNDLPVIGGSPTTTVNEGAAYSFAPAASDVDTADVLSFSISNKPSWASFNPATGVLSGTPAKTDVGVTSGIVISVSDGSLTAALPAFSLTVTSVNTAPVISGNPATSVDEGAAYSFTPIASDADAETTLTFSISNKPTWASFNPATGALSGTPAKTDVGLTSGIVISVSDGSLTAALPAFSLTVTSVNTAPVISGSPATSVNEGAAYSFTPTASDADADTTLTFSISNKPVWASFNPATGALSGTPAKTDVGVTSGIVISVSDGSLTAALPAFSLTVTNANAAPVATDLSSTVVEDGSVSLTLVGTDPDGDALSYELVSQPTHGSVSLQGEVLVYTPEKDFNGADSVSYIAKDAELSSAPAVVSLTVTAVNDNPVAVVDTSSLQRNDTNQYQLAVLANDVDVDNDTLAIDGASTSVGTVTFNAQGLSLTAPDLYVGPVSLRYTLSDGKGGRASADVNLIIEGGIASELPVITVPADIEVNATALFTRVPLGTATAVDRNGRRLRVSLINGSLFFAPGEHIVYWQATDADGNTATKAQKVSVHPLVSLSKDQIATEGNEVEVQVILNGPAPVYPVLVPYSVSGSAGSNDHTLVSGVAEVSSGLSTSIRFSLLDDAVIDSPEDILITLDSSVNRGSKRSSRIVVSEANIAPVVSLAVTQNGLDRLTISEGDGMVTVAATVTDANSQDQLTGSWDLGRLENVSSDQTQLSFDPAEQGPGLYQVSYTATDNGTPNLSATSRVFIVVRPSLPTLGSDDSDGDLIPDDQEGFADSDGDGIPDYQDAISECNVMPTELLGQTDFVAEGEPGVCLRLGTVAAETDAGGLQIAKDAIETDNVAVNIGGIFDFIAYGLPEQGQSYSLVIPQRLPVPANAVYRKFNDVTGWVDFVSNTNNSVSSAAGERGFCPPPGDAVWTEGLTEGHWCVQVRVQDGGPNDADGIANGAIVDPGGVAVELSGNNLPVAVADQVTIQANQSVEVNVLANDTDADSDVLIISQAISGFGTVTILADQHLSYTPNIDFIGTDTVIYSVTDGKGGTASSELVVTIQQNTAPVAVNDSASTDDRTAIVIKVLANDTDADGQTLSVSSATAVRGTVAIQADQSIRYTPAVGFNGTDTISYTITDGAGGEATAQVAVTVRAYQAVVVDNKSGGGSMSLWMVVMLAGVVVLRRRSLLGLAAVLLLSFSSFSQSADWYLQGSVGTSKADQQQSQLLDGVPAGTVTGFDDSDSLYGVNLGYKVHPYVAVELGYLDLGEASSQISGDSLTPAQYHELVKTATPVLADGWTLSARLSVWQNEQWSIEVPLGLFKWQSEIESSLNGSTLNTDLDGTDWFLGAQLNYQFAPDWLVGLGFQQLNLAPNDINSWLLSVRYQF